MNGFQKTCNVLGIVLAWFLSIVLVILLVATPMVFSALSLLDADTITKAVTQGFTPSAEVPEQTDEIRIVQLSNTTQENTSTNMLGGLEELFDGNISQQSMDAILSSDVVKELLDTYIGDVANAFTGNSGQAQFNSEKLKSIVGDNIDELADVLKKNIPELADMDLAELKSNILKAVDEGAEEIVQALPKPEDIKREIMQSNPELETALKLLVQKNTIKLAIIGVLVVLSGLIFACRIPGLRGFRWLAVDLFVGGGFGAFITVGLLVSKSAVSQIAKQAGTQVAGIIGALLSEFTNGMLVRTVVMLVAGGALLTVYILIKKQKAKKLAAAEQTEELPAAEAPAEEASAEEEISAEEVSAEEVPAEEAQA